MMFLRWWIMSAIIATSLVGCVDSTVESEVDGGGKTNYNFDIKTFEDNTSENVTKKDVIVSLYSYATDSVIKTFSDEEYEENLKDLLFDEDWMIIQNISNGGLKEVAAFVVNQERTILAGEDKHTPKSHEEIVRYIVYENSPYVGMLIAEDAVKNMHLPLEYRLMFLEIPDEELAVLKSYMEESSTNTSFQLGIFNTHSTIFDRISATLTEDGGILNGQVDIVGADSTSALYLEIKEDADIKVDYSLVRHKGNIRIAYIASDESETTLIDTSLDDSNTIDDTVTLSLKKGTGRIAFFGDDTNYEFDLKFLGMNQDHVSYFDIMSFKNQ